MMFLSDNLKNLLIKTANKSPHVHKYSSICIRKDTMEPLIKTLAYNRFRERQQERILCGLLDPYRS